MSTRLPVRKCGAGHRREDGLQVSHTSWVSNKKVAKISLLAKAIWRLCLKGERPTLWRLEANGGEVISHYMTSHIRVWLKIIDPR